MRVSVQMAMTMRLKAMMLLMLRMMLRMMTRMMMMSVSSCPPSPTGSYDGCMMRRNDVIGAND